MRAGTVQVNNSFVRPTTGGTSADPTVSVTVRVRVRVRGGDRAYGRPVVTVRSVEKAPHVPSGSFARIRTRWVSPASLPT